MVEIREAIVVEGRYDKNTLSQVVRAPIIETEGFGIMKNREKLNLLRRIAAQRGLIIFTDGDGAGFVIRNYLKSTIPGKYLKHAYIPDIFGKERRKAAPGKEGKLGVEGMRPEILIDALQKAGATLIGGAAENRPSGEITKQDFAQWGLSGGAGSSFLRKKLQKELNLPEHLSANGLIDVLNLLYTRQEVEEILRASEITEIKYD